MVLNFTEVHALFCKVLDVANNNLKTIILSLIFT